MKTLKSPISVTLPQHSPCATGSPLWPDGLYQMKKGTIVNATRAKVMPGDRYGMWTVVKEDELYYMPSGHVRRFLCKCDCGNLKTIRLATLKKAKSCGCIKKKSNGRVEVPIGTKYGKLTAIMEMNPRRYPSGQIVRSFLFRCECGKEKILLLRDVRYGVVKSCGCFGKNEYFVRELHRTWAMMKTRCESPKAINRKYYHDKGIIVCKEWSDNYTTFAKWALTNGWKRGLQIDRIDGNGNYTPDNCRFVTSKENSRNKTCLNRYMYNGQMLIFMEILELLGREKEEHYLRARLWKGWTLEETLSIPKMGKVAQYRNLKK